MIDVDQLLADTERARVSRDAALTAEGHEDSRDDDMLAALEIIAHLLAIISETANYTALYYQQAHLQAAREFVDWMNE